MFLTEILAEETTDRFEEKSYCINEDTSIILLEGGMYYEDITTANISKVFTRVASLIKADKKNKDFQYNVSKNVAALKSELDDIFIKNDSTGAKRVIKTYGGVIFVYYIKDNMLQKAPIAFFKRTPNSKGEGAEFKFAGKYIKQVRKELKRQK